MMRYLLGILCSAGFLVGCEQQGPELMLRAPDRQEQAAATSVAEAQNRFGLAMMGSILPEKSDANFCYSPFSLYQAFCLLLNGSAGSTRSVLEKELGYPGANIDSINSGNYGLLAQMLGRDFSSANSIWLDPDVQPKSGYTKALRDFYSADVKNGGEFDAKTVKQVNEWVSEKTRGRIPQLVERFPDLTVLVLVNALAFDGEWVSAFNRDGTRDRPFLLASGERVQVPMMSQKREFDTATVARAQALWMPYKESTLEFVAILPPDGVTARDYLKGLTPDSWASLAAARKKQEITVMLPRFQMNTGGDITAQLKRTSLAPLFQEMDLSAVNDDLSIDTRIGQVVQKCFISVDEAGTQAAAATEIAVERKSMSKSFVASHPFVFALVHAPTNAIVMIGVVNDPRG